MWLFPSFWQSHKSDGGEHFSYLLVWKWLNDFFIHLLIECVVWCVQPDRPGFFCLPLPKIEMLMNFCLICASLSQMLNFKNADNTSDYFRVDEGIRYK